MFYQVKILSSQGKVKKLVSSKELHKKHWDTFESMMTQPSYASTFDTKKIKQKRLSDPIFFNDFLAQNEDEMRSGNGLEDFKMMDMCDEG